MKYAIVINGKVEKIFNDDLPLEMVQKNSAAVIVPDGASCEVGFIYSNGVFITVEPAALTAIKDVLDSEIDKLNIKYPALELTQDDTILSAIPKLLAVEALKDEVVYLKMLYDTVREAQA